MTATAATLTLIDGTKVVVPDSLNLITPYVLREQQDWFEDEIKFLRHILKPGQKVIDIGANYGVYTLSMAQAVGSGGRVWAFEPASSTADFLARGIAANGFTHVTLEKSALSSVSGTARLSLNDNSELNELVRDGAAAGASETVPLTTLDDCLERFGWQDIDVMKIDAEGEEANILKGGQHFFTKLSPLVEYEVKAGNDLHLELVEAFAGLGYESYRLVPGLNVLVPFKASSTPDPFLLNLFCCKRDRAERLAVAGHLVAASAGTTHTITSTELSGYQWRQMLARMPYGQTLSGMWEATIKAGKSADVEIALACFSRSQDTSLTAAQRFASLESSFSLLQRLVADNPSYLRLSSLARVARAYGARGVAANALVTLANQILQQRTADPAEPFLMPSLRFDKLAPGSQIGNWILAGVLEALEETSAFSSFYTGLSSKQRLDFINGLGFANTEMRRRLELLKQRYGLN